MAPTLASRLAARLLTSPAAFFVAGVLDLLAYSRAARGERRRGSRAAAPREPRSRDARR